jgi:hypothetical protein
LPADASAAADYDHAFVRQWKHWNPPVAVVPLPASRVEPARG